MSELVLDKGAFFPSPLRGWYRERPFKAALAGSLLIHALLIAVIPGFRAVDIDVPKPLSVEIIEESPVAEPLQREARKEVTRPTPAVVPPPVAAQPDPAPEQPLLRPEPRRPEPAPVPQQPVVEPQRVPEPMVQAPPQAVEPLPEVIRELPRPERVPEAPVVVPRSDPRPVPQVAPRPEVEARPDMPTPRVAPQQPPVLQRTEPVPLAQQEAPPRAEISEAPRVAPSSPPIEPPQATESRPAPESERSLVNGYEKSLSDLIRRQESYPDRARRQRWEGTAVVGLSLSAEGRVTDIALLESSGREILDEAALKMVRRATPLPRAPEGLRGKERVVRVPIVFKLQNS